MIILEAIRRAVGDGTLQEPFTLEQVAAALRGQYYCYASLASALCRYSRPGAGHLGQPLRRVERGKYCLAGDPMIPDHPPDPPPGV